MKNSPPRFRGGDEKRGDSGNREKCFASTQYSTERYRPRFEVSSSAAAIVPNGIYYVRSQVSGSPYLTTDVSSLNNTNVYQQTALTSGNAVNGTNQMWRVVHIQNGYYTVRPYHYTPAGLACYHPNNDVVMDENAALFIEMYGYADEENGGDLEAASYAISYILGRNQQVYYNFGSRYSEQALRSLLDSGNIVYLSRGSYENGARVRGHATVLYDYYWDAEHEMYLYNIQDPSPVNTGKTYRCSYSALCNGANRVYEDDPEYDTAIWDGVLTFCVGNYQNTIPVPEVSGS